ncbi:MAG TPA: DUF4199 domain-containing protein [Gemmatimonadaceae bacterium]|nr:DUF4199 domain-containing protein [Gemmatimonadaceae bacterium]
MKKTVLTFGVISGLIVSGMLVITMPFHEQIGWDRAEVIGYASMLAAFLLIYFGVRSYRDNMAGGSVTLGRAFKVGALIALVSAVMYTATWQVLYFGFDSDFAEVYAEHQMDEAREKGATQAELDRKAAEMKRFAEMYQNPVINAGITLMEALPLGLVVAFLSAIALSRRGVSAPSMSPS